MQVEGERMAQCEVLYSPWMEIIQKYPCKSALCLVMGYINSIKNRRALLVLHKVVSLEKKEQE